MQHRRQGTPLGSGSFFLSFSCGGEKPRKNTRHRFFFGCHLVGHDILAQGGGNSSLTGLCHGKGVDKKQAIKPK